MMLVKKGRKKKNLNLQYSLGIPTRRNNLREQKLSRKIQLVDLAFKHRVRETEYQITK